MAVPIASHRIQDTPPQQHGSPGLIIVPETAVPAGQAQQPPLTLEEAKSAFLRALAGKNRTASTITAYASDLTHFLSWLQGNNIVAEAPHQIQRADITGYLAHLAQQNLMGVSHLPRQRLKKAFLPSNSRSGWAMPTSTRPKSTFT